jgi:hypothetical protein
MGKGSAARASQAYDGCLFHCGGSEAGEGVTANDGNPDPTPGKESF